MRAYSERQVDASTREDRYAAMLVDRIEPWQDVHGFAPLLLEVLALELGTLVDNHVLRSNALLENPLNGRLADMDARPCQLVGDLHLAQCRAEQLGPHQRRSERSPGTDSPAFLSEAANRHRPYEARS